MYFILHVLIRLTVKMSESIHASSLCESHRLLLMALFMPYVTFDYVMRLRF